MLTSAMLWYAHKINSFYKVHLAKQLHRDAKVAADA